MNHRNQAQRDTQNTNHTDLICSHFSINLINIRYAVLSDIALFNRALSKLFFDKQRRCCSEMLLSRIQMMKSATFVYISY